MAYQVQRSAKIEEELELLTEDGDVAEVIYVRLDAGAIAKQVSEKYADLLKLQSGLSTLRAGEDKRKALEELGNGVVLLFETIFGEENTRKILLHYRHDYVDMCRSLMPFITDTIIPKVRREAQKSRKVKIQSYSRRSAFRR